MDRAVELRRDSIPVNLLITRAIGIPNKNKALAEKVLIREANKVMR